MNKNNLQSFYRDIVSKKAYYLPIILFSIVAYGFSMMNRTVSWDDMLQDHYFGSGQIALAGRWGMLFLVKLFGVVDFNPFVDRFMSMLFLMLAATALCFVFYVSGRSRNVWGYALFSSLFVTYPLINEIWEYQGANFFTGIGCLLSTLAVALLRWDISKAKRMIWATLLLLLPVASYESAAFYYVTLVCFIAFYDTVVVGEKPKSFREWILLFVPYVLPLIFAVIIRFGVSAVLCWIWNLSPVTGGNTEIHWLTGSFASVLMHLVKINVMQYVFAALIYLPITEFLVASIIFVAYIVGCAIHKKSAYPVIMGIIVLLSVFLLAIVKGDVLSYRNTLTLTLFVPVAFYLLYQYVQNRGKKALTLTLSILLFALCWHQSVCLNNILSLNNQRSDNELAMLHGVGQRITADYEKKPVFFVSPCSQGEWVRNRTHVNPNSWNGRLYDALLKYVVSDPANYDVSSQRIFETNVTIMTKEYNGLRELFTYLGYDIDVIGPVEKPYTEEHQRRDLTQLEKATRIAKESDMRPFQIKDMGDYLIVMLGNDEYMIDSFR